MEYVVSTGMGDQVWVAGLFAELLLHIRVPISSKADILATDNQHVGARKLSCSVSTAHVQTIAHMGLGEAQLPSCTVSHGSDLHARSEVQVRCNHSTSS